MWFLTKTFTKVYKPVIRRSIIDLQILDLLSDAVEKSKSNERRITKILTKELLDLNSWQEPIKVLLGHFWRSSKVGGSENYSTLIAVKIIMDEVPNGINFREYKFSRTKLLLIFLGFITDVRNTKNLCQALSYLNICVKSLKVGLFLKFSRGLNFANPGKIREN